MDGPNLWIVLALGLVAIGWYLTYTAARLDRLHARVQGTLAALDAQLVRRAEATLELANARVLDAASALMLAPRRLVVGRRDGATPTGSGSATGTRDGRVRRWRPFPGRGVSATTSCRGCEPPGCGSSWPAAFTTTR
jgi:hypothetical protein